MKIHIDNNVKIESSIYMDIMTFSSFFSDPHINIDLENGVNCSQSNDSGVELSFYRNPTIKFDSKYLIYCEIYAHMLLNTFPIDDGFKESFNIRIVLPAWDFGRVYLYEMEISYDKNPDIKFKFEFDPKNKIYTDEIDDVKLSRTGNSSFSLTNNDILTVYLYNQYKRLNALPEEPKPERPQAPLALENIDTASFTITKLILKREYL